MIGKTISHYKILEKLGEGGMGVVYKAKHLKLDSFVALKFLPPQLVTQKAAKKRFIHEAKAASSLEHPNICAVHDIDETPDGRMFIVMPYYEGETLQEKVERGPLEFDEAIHIASQVASGLARAHEKGIVHRDVKSANILIANDGHVRILDFGLAKLAKQTRLTKTGTTVGTVMYMSPEQAKGDDVDRRSDIWSLGVMLYEMLTGHLPFRGEIEQAVIYSILNEEPEPITTARREVPLQLEALVEKALAKTPEKRYQQMEELLADLEIQREELALGIKPRRFIKLRRLRRKRWFRYGAMVSVFVILMATGMQFFGGRNMAIHSIAVLPLENLSGDPEQEYFADGMTDALIADLAQIGALRVISRTSVMQYKGGVRKPLPEIARELNVDAIIEGSVFREGDRVRITAQLIHAQTDRHLWADSYVREFVDILTLHSEVARAIAREVKARVTPEEETRLARTRPVDPEAYELYLRGRAFAQQKWSVEAFEKSFEYLGRAIERTRPMLRPMRRWPVPTAKPPFSTSIVVRPIQRPRRRLHGRWNWTTGLRRPMQLSVASG